MAVGKNKKVPKGGKGGKGAKKKVDPFSKKEWYDVKAPSMFTNRNVGKTLVTRSAGNKMAADGLKGRVFEVSLVELKGDDTSRKFKLCVEEVRDKDCLTNFHGMSLATDKLKQMIKKWQTLVEGNVNVETTDGYSLRVFCIGFTKKQLNSPKKTCYAKSTQVKALRKVMVDTIRKEVSSSNLKTFVAKMIPDSLSKDIEKKCMNVYPVQEVHIRKVKVLKKPRFDIGKLMELHGDVETVTVVGGGGGDEGERVVRVGPGGAYEPPVMETV